jgi:hypothetical protein
MAATKDCPSCGTVVPAAATRCKNCFHDFTEVKSTNYAGPVLLLGAGAVIVLMILAALAFVAMQPVDRSVLVDEQTQSVVFVTKYRTGDVTDRLPWASIGKIEHVMEDGEFSVVAVTFDGDRYSLRESTTASLAGEAERYGELMGKPVEDVDHTTQSALLNQAAPPPPPAP